MYVVILARSNGDAQCLKLLLRRKFKELYADVEIRQCEAYEPLRDASFAFFDADMPESLRRARALRADGAKMPIVFFSDTDEHALGCYGAHPAGYLVKPFDYEQLRGILDWHRSAFTSALRYLEVVSGRAPVKVYLADIIYIEIQAHTSVIHHSGGVITTSRSLTSIEARLDDKDFLRVHRSYLVNMWRIDAIEREDVLMDNMEALPVGAENAAKTRRAHSELIKVNEIFV